jgi:histidyl-tRNA synthetase
MQFMQVYGMGDRVAFDIAVVRGLAYYTGIVFEAFDVDRELRALFGGGRYDNLLGDMGGQPASGVGLGFGDVVVMELLAARNRLPDAGGHDTVFVGYMQDAQRVAGIRLADRLRSEGRCVDLALAPMKARTFFSRAGKGGFRQAVYVGPDDVQQGTCRLKTLATREEQELPLPS